jgi:hypothetical protein
MWRVPLALACVLALPLAADDDDNLTKLRIEVKDRKDRPVESAAVVVRFVEGRSIAKFGKKIITQWQLRTNQEGVAKVPELPQGKIRIQIIAKGYQTFGDTFDVQEPEKTIAIKLNPPQPQHSAHQ